MTRSGFILAPPLVAAVTLLILALLPTATTADTVILQNGKKKVGKVVHVGRDHITLQVDEYLQLKLYRSQIQQIITNRPPPAIGNDPNAVPFRQQAKPPGGTPERQTIDPDEFKVPAPALIHDPAFKAERTDGGLSDGKTLGIDGRPLSDHHIFARDSEYVARKFRDGMIRATPVEARDRLARLRFLATEIATVQRLQKELTSGMLLESRKQARETLLDSHERFQTEATKYREQYGHDALRAPEYPFAQLIADLESHVRAYHHARTLVRAEEKLGVRDRIDLTDGETDRAKSLRVRIKQSIIDLAATRAALFKRFPHFYAFGQLPEEPHRETPKAWYVVADNTLLFPYPEIEGSVAYNGLLEASRGDDVTRAKPLILAKGQQIQHLRHRTIDYPASGEQPARQLDVIEIRIPKSGAVVFDFSSGKRIPDMELRGWVIADRIELR